MYGIDAPRVVTALAVVAPALAAAGLFLYFRPVFASSIYNMVACGAFLLAAVGCGYSLFNMLYSSLIQKPQVAEHMLDLIEGIHGGPHYWNTVNKVLDVGCGRGLMMNAAAKRLLKNRKSEFTVCGVDIFTADLSGNTMRRPLDNAKAEGIPEGLVEVKKCDARKIDYEDSYFDLVVSSLVIHNVAEGKDK